MRAVIQNDDEDYVQLYRNTFDLRVSINKKLVQWGGKTTVTVLLGYHNWYDLTEEHIKVLKQLDGPYGYAIYRMLEARHDNIQD